MNRLVVPTPPAVAPDRPQHTDARLRGRWLLLARAVWLAVAALALGLFVAGIPAEFAQLQVECPTEFCPSEQLPPAGRLALQDLGLSLGFVAAYGVVLDVVFAAVYVAVAALIFWRKSAERFALFVAFALLTFGTATFPEALYALAAAHSAWWPPVAVLNFLGAASFGLFLYLFPDGRFMPRWTRWVALAWIAWQLPKYWFRDWPEVYDERDDPYTALARLGQRMETTLTPDAVLPTIVETVALAERMRPDVILMDIRMPGINGIEATRRILHTSPHIRILIVTMSEDDASVFTAMRAGARGYVLKESQKDDMLRAIRAVGRGEAIFSPAVASRLIDFFAAPRPGAPPQAFPELTEREREILDLIAQGHSNPDIAEKLVLSPHTVRNYVSNIFGKTRFFGALQFEAARSDAFRRSNAFGPPEGVTTNCKAESARQKPCLSSRWSIAPRRSSAQGRPGWAATRENPENRSSY